MHNSFREKEIVQKNGGNQLRYSGFLAKKWAMRGGKVINNLPVFGGGLEKFWVNISEIGSQYWRNWGSKTSEIESQFR